MGYRLEISEIKKHHIEYMTSGGKLYGYVENIEDLKSYNWLLNKKIIDEDQYFDYNCNPKIVLNSNEFNEFVLLYNEDLNNYYKYDTKDWFINDEKVRKLLSNKNKKVLEWW